MFPHRENLFLILQIPLILYHCAEEVEGFVAPPAHFSQQQQQGQLQQLQQRRNLNVLHSMVPSGEGDAIGGSHGSGQHQKQQHRRSFLHNLAITTTSTAASSSFMLLSSAPSNAAEEVQVPVGEKFQRIKPKLNFAYEFIPPPSVITTSNKPLQTHLDEINLPTNTRGYTYGVTVDPIRISSLKEFGTPDEVAAKIVMAELRRDGVLDVTLAADASEDELSGAYEIEYISDGTRGKKHFVTRTIVKEGKLFVLTVQVKEDDWSVSPALQREVMDAVRTFRVLDKGMY